MAEPGLDDAVLAGVVGEGDAAAAGGEAVDGVVDGARQDAELVVDGDAEGLERAPGRVAARWRRMPMTGVIPLPAVTKSSFSGTGSGSTNSPAGGPIRSREPTGVRCASAPDTVPPGTAVTVTASRGSPGREVTE